MDKKSFLAMIIVAIIIVLMPYYNEYVLGIKPEQKSGVTEKPAVIEPSPASEMETREKQAVPEIKKEETVKETLSNAKGDSVEKVIKINTEKYNLVISNRGGGSLLHYQLTQYKTYDSSLVELVSEEIKNGINISFQNMKGDFVKLDNMLFSVNKEGEYTLKNEDSLVIEYSLVTKDGNINKRFIFYNNRYHFDLEVSVSHPEELFLNRSYQLVWKNGLPATEAYIEDDYTYNEAFAYMADELEPYKIDEEGVAEQEEFSGKAEWIAIRNKYFVSAIVARKADVSEGVFFNGFGVKKNEILYKYYNAGYYVQSGGKDRFSIYIGPLDYKELAHYDNSLDELIMSDGWSVFRPISRYLILPVLEWLNSFIPNYGLVIIIFSIMVKLILFPLTKHSYQSQKRMQKMQPLMNEIKEKYKNDQQRQQKEMIELYKKHGNPMSGCLPMLLQMPLLFALYQVFKSTIQLRGAMFIPGWINDLSTSEALFTLPVSLPFYGNEFNLLPVLMALTMFFQSKMTMQDPKQKSMVYFMPLFMLVLFNRFPSGLNLYYTLFNLLTIVQQKYIHVEDEEVKPSVKKPSGKKKK